MKSEIILISGGAALFHPASNKKNMEAQWLNTNSGCPIQKEGLSKNAEAFFVCKAIDSCLFIFRGHFIFRLESNSSPCSVFFS
ncbi:hypothetical protein [Lacrimispora sphenoides]|uniref:Uncharacterized protein n=1 Tax=Lacrimispora sphenoides JCM 1415 TaxID=1297793 RepID=A0ABY1C0Y9_9FIRM|nr:hypothetical protein [Lacrimispora sphenoides]SET50308.1 hypothetical protein SAMN02745906_0092 [[Clostridium] sphenoides JCM 1415]SUY49491.1 Uncharacterised protein [Lacrimispora sphenoides]